MTDFSTFDKGLDAWTARGVSLAKKVPADVVAEMNASYRDMATLVIDLVRTLTKESKEQTAMLRKELDELNKRFEALKFVAEEMAAWARSSQQPCPKDIAASAAKDASR